MANITEAFKNGYAACNPGQETIHAKPGKFTAGAPDLTIYARLRYILSMCNDLQVVLCTVPDRNTAESIAGTLVAERLAACINIMSDVTSIYRWKDTIEHDQELLLMIKTSVTAWPRLVERIRGLHPYELPEIIAVPINNGQSDYIKWLQDSLTTS